MKKSKKLFVNMAVLWVTVALTLLLFPGCQSKSKRAPGMTSSLPPGMTTLPGADPYESNTLKVGDVLRITFAGATNLDTVQKIQLNGAITLPLVGEVQAVDKAILDFQDELIKLYDPHLKLNDINVTLAGTTLYVYVTGAVLQPGKVPLERSLTVLDAVMEAGGFNPNRAKLTEVMILRLEEGIQMTHRVNLKKILAGKSSGVFYLKPYDTVFVPERIFNF